MISIEKGKAEGTLRTAIPWVWVLAICLSAGVGTLGAQSQTQPDTKQQSYLVARATDPKPATASTEAKPEPAAASSKTDNADLEEQLDELRSVMDSQAAQIDAQREALKQQQQKMEALEQQLKAASTTTGLTVSAAPAPTTGATTSASAATIPLSMPAASPAAAAPQGNAVPASPLQFQIGNAFITPIGFMDFTTVYRSTNAGGGIGSNFGSIPYNLTSAAGNLNPAVHNSETRMSMQNSRIGFRVDGLVAGAHVIGYFEGDFLGNNPTNVAVSSNSNTFRSRLYWVDVAKDKWEILGGQTWSLITPGRSGISPLPGNIFYSQDTDVNYQIGLAWGRIPELRFVYHPNGKTAIAVALDNQEQYWGGSSGGPKPLLPTGASVVAGVSALPGTQLNDNTTTTNAPAVFPDVIVKIAVDPSPKFHAEIGGVERQFRVAVSSTTSAASPIVKQGMSGGGAFLNLNGQVFNGMRLLTNLFWNEGGGRYIFGQVPDLIVNPDGSLSPIRSASTVTGFEYTHKNTLFYGYYGGVYVHRALNTANGNQYGYGVTATAANFATAISQNKAIQEATIGFNQTIWKDTKYGAVNLMGQYSYLIRNPWSVPVGDSRHASVNLVFFNLRYTLPGAAPAMGQLK